MEKMHADELDIDRSLVARLLAEQFPQWADLPLTPVASAGTDNALFRLSADMAARLPRVAEASSDVDKEHCWLPRLAPQLPLAVPLPLARGRPGAGYPWSWSVGRWLDGEDAQRQRVIREDRAARDLAAFIAALQRLAAEGWPPPAPPAGPRGVPLATRDAPTRAAIAALSGQLDTDAVTSAWEAALQAPAWPGPPVWTHGDLLPGNLLVQEGRISAVIDFGCLGVGDPACDLIVAWALLSAQARVTFRAALTVDAVTWARGRGWALSIGLIARSGRQRRTIQGSHAGTVAGADAALSLSDAVARVDGRASPASVATRRGGPPRRSGGRGRGRRSRRSRRSCPPRR